MPDLHAPRRRGADREGEGGKERDTDKEGGGGVETERQREGEKERGTHKQRGREKAQTAPASTQTGRHTGGGAAAEAGRGECTAKAKQVGNFR